jgi:hypothetical protein
VRFVHADAYRLDAGLGLFQAAFAGFWLSHVPRARVGEFLQGLHQRLEPGASVVLVDNSDAHSQDVPVSDEDVDGNTFQTRQLADGSRFRVLKNFHSEAELASAIQPSGVNPRYWKLRHFWVLSYELRRWRSRIDAGIRS